MASPSMIRFPAGFRWGAATSAHQVEGNNCWNDWWHWERRSGGDNPKLLSGEGCRHWQTFDRDFALAADDGHNAHRMSIEWSRVEPERGRIEPEAVAHYHEAFASLRRHGLMPVVTLMHFTVPVWIAKLGGWEARETIDHFCRFVDFCAREYGGEVDWWCTVNEPEVLAFRAYAEGTWPPERRDESAALVVIANQLEAHGRAYRALCSYNAQRILDLQLRPWLTTIVLNVSRNRTRRPGPLTQPLDGDDERPGPATRLISSDQPAVIGFEFALIRKGLLADWPDEPITKRLVQMSVAAGVTKQTIDFPPVSRSKDRAFVATFTASDIMRRGSTAADPHVALAAWNDDAAPAFD